MTPDLATENAALWAAIDQATTTIDALKASAGTTDPQRFERAMDQLTKWTRTSMDLRLAHLRGDHRRGMVVRALEEAA